MKDTAGPCSIASFGVSSKVLSGTSSDASEEVLCCPASSGATISRGAEVDEWKKNVSRWRLARGGILF